MHKTIRFIRKYLHTFLSVFDQNIIKRLLGGEFIQFLDIGAEGGISPRWKKYEPLISYIGFEPDSRAMANFPKSNFKTHKIFPTAIGEKEEIEKINLTYDIGKSSVFKPNINFLKRFPNSNRFTITRSEDLKIDSIDNLIESGVDFIKLDIQGGELNALKGAKHNLKNAMGIEIEIEFLELYINQPLFGDVCKFLVSHNFEFLDFINLCRWERKNFNGFGQLVFGDALFIKPPEFFFDEDHSDVEIRKYLAILYVYNRFDLIEESFILKLNLKDDLHKFYISQRRKYRFFTLMQKISRVINMFYSFFGVEFKNHIMY